MSQQDFEAALAEVSPSLLSGVRFFLETDYFVSTTARTLRLAGRDASLQDGPAALLGRDDE